jgi:tetratricopeptide (TPR) repeat protein
MKYLSAILSVSLLFFAGCGNSDQQPQDKAGMLLRQSVEEMNRQNFDEAERLAVECITLHSEENNETKLAEDYSTLSTIQILSGKLSPALETLSALRELHRRSSDRSAELQTMLQTAKLYFQLGKSADAVTLLTEVHNNAKLFRLGQIAATAAIDLSVLHLTLHQYNRASSAALNAYSAAQQLHHTPSVIEALKLRMHAAAASGDVDNAYVCYREASALVAAGPKSDRSAFTLAAGKAFSAAGEWNFARTLFEAVIPDQGSGAQDITPAVETAARIGLGELYFRHFAHAEAQIQFVKAHTVARNSSDPLTQSYLLIRIADCLSQRIDAAGSRDGIIRAEQLYEQAMTLYNRSGFHLGEALALHRLGRLKEMNGDENGAVTFYKRAFDKYSDHYVDPQYFTGTAEVSVLMNSPATRQGSDQWFSVDLIMLLLKYNRVQEAFGYQQTVRSLSMLSTIDDLALRFSDPKKDKRVASLQQSINLLRQNILEAYHSSSGTTVAKNRSYLSKLQQQTAYARSKVLSDAVTLSGEYPSFTFLAASKRTVPSAVITALPSNTAAAEFVIGRNQAWAFLLRPNEEPAAVKLSSYGYSLTAKMERFTDLLSDPSSVQSELTLLSGELYGYLLRPLDLAGMQRLIIIPPMSHERFPFQALTDNGTPILEKLAVSFVPHSSFIASAPSAPKFINTVSAFGFTSNSRWGLEFELRDIRSFFRNVQVNNNQTATKERLESAVGEILQISSEFSEDKEGGAWFTLSDGSTSKAGVNFPAADFTQLHPFKIVSLTDVRSTGNSITPLHPFLWMLNGTGSVIVNHFPITSTVSRGFGENFYASMSTEIDPYLAYRRAATALGRKKEFLQGTGSALYFFYGVR